MGGASVRMLTEQAHTVATALAGVLDTLPAGDWQRPSDCAGWSIAQLVAHLVQVEDLLGSSVRRGLEGDSSAPPRAADGLPAWRAWRAQEIARLSALPLPELRQLYGDGAEVMHRTLLGLAESPTANGSGWHPTAGVQPLPWFAGQWLVEITLHDWDLRVALDPDARVHDAALAGLGQEMRSRMPRCFKPDGRFERAGIVQVVLEGAQPTIWRARVSNDGVELLETDASPSDATIETDAGTYALVQTRRRPAAHFEGRGRWRTSGDAALLAGLAASFAGY